LINLKTKEFKQDTTKRSFAKPKKEITKADYVNHQLAVCHRLNFDYHNSVKYYKRVVDNGSYPEDMHHYAWHYYKLKIMTLPCFCLKF
jgi:hypothetical protein